LNQENCSCSMTINIEMILFCPFSLGWHCVVCSLIYGFWLPSWYLQTLLTYLMNAIYSLLVIFRNG
jgi:hypothetical protein